MYQYCLGQASEAGMPKLSLQGCTCSVLSETILIHKVQLIIQNYASQAQETHYPSPQ